MWFIFILSSLVPLVSGKATDSHDLDRTSRIIGGEDITDIDKWPWLVSLTAAVPKTKIGGLTLTWDYYYCGASVINKRWVLTAAHCADVTRDPSQWTARMASVKLSSGFVDKIKHFLGYLFNRQDWMQWDIAVEEIIIHERYDATKNWINDIALFKLAQDVPVGDEVKEIKQISLPESKSRSFPVPGQRCVMKGWGCTEGGGPVAYYAKEVILPIVDDRKCRSIWRVDPISRLCAGHLYQNIGICPGDSGGPLVCQSEDKWIQVGIASFASVDEPGEYYGAFTRVAHFLKWINEKMDAKI